MPVPTPEQIDAYEAAPAHIAAAIAGLSNVQMRDTPSANEWSIHGVVVHLADSESFGYERIRRTIAEEKPTLHAYPEETWAQRLSYRTQNYRLALDLFAAQRRATAALLRTLLAEAWKRIGVHEEHGEMSLYDIFLDYLDHGKAHLEQIERLKQH